MKYIKNDLTELRKKIKETREISKTAKDMWDRSSAQCKLHSLKQQYRNKHVLYCLCKGRTYKEIEAKVREDNELHIPSLKRLCIGYETLSFNEISEEQLEGLLKW